MYVGPRRSFSLDDVLYDDVIAWQGELLESVLLLPHSSDKHDLNQCKFGMDTYHWSGMGGGGGLDISRPQYI